MTSYHFSVRGKQTIYHVSMYSFIQYHEKVQGLMYKTRRLLLAIVVAAFAN